MIRRKLFGSLAFRVLFSSLIFIVVPLIFYAIFLSNNEYQEKLDDVFTEMHLYQKDQLNLIVQTNKNNYNFLKALQELINLIIRQSGKPSLDKIDKILTSFVAEENLSAIFYLTITKDSGLVCTNSSLPSYLGINFTQYFDLTRLEPINYKIFIASDPVFKHSLFITLPVKNDQEKIIGFVGMSIALSKLVESLDSSHRPAQSNLSLIDEKGLILASTASSRISKKLILEEKIDSKHPEDVIPIKKIPSVPGGYEFHLNKEKRLLTFIIIPETELKIVLTIPANSLLLQLYKNLTKLAILLLFILTFGGLISYLLTLRFAKPLRQLSLVMEKVGTGDLSAKFHPDKMGFEINLLGEQFNQMTLSLVTYIEEVNKERAFKEAYLKELQIGRDIQKSLLPEGKPEFYNIESAFYFQPAKEVAGDFYDWTIKGDDLYITIADGVGKGISGCLYAYDLRSTLKTCENLLSDLDTIAIQTNLIFCEDTKETGSFVTAFLAKYHAPSKELSYINCGHNYPILKKKSGELIHLETRGIAFGVDRFDRVDLRKITLEADDLLIFFTDGLTDAQDTKGRLFGEKKFFELIQSASNQSPSDLLEHITSEIAKFTYQADQYDDMTLFILKM